MTSQRCFHRRHSSPPSRLRSPIAGGWRAYRLTSRRRRTRPLHWPTQLHQPTGLLQWPTRLRTRPLHWPTQLHQPTGLLQWPPRLRMGRPHLLRRPYNRCRLHRCHHTRHLVPITSPPRGQPRACRAALSRPARRTRVLALPLTETLIPTPTAPHGFIWSHVHVRRHALLHHE